MQIQARAQQHKRRRAHGAGVGVPTWADIARPEQLPPAGEWLIWYIQAGRGWGKTRTGAESAWEASKTSARIAIVAESFSEGRDVCIEGETGIKTLHHDLVWNRSIGEMTFPNGARGKIYSAEDPDSLRGPNNYFAWCDEIAKWRYLKQTWDQLMFTLRKGDVRTVITTTPRPLPLLKELKARPTTHLTRGTTYDNLANLSPAFIDTIITSYEGTALGRQELDAEDIEDVEGAMWRRSWIEQKRISKAEMPHLERVVVAIDPSATAGGDEAGVITAGVGMCSCKGEPELHGFVRADDSIQARPERWALNAVTAYHEHQADKMIAESNNGGEMVRVVINMIPGSPRVKLIHASRGKQTRAEPVALLYEQGMVHHVGTFPQLEDEQCSWQPGDASPNRFDALVWAMTELMLGLKVGIR